MRNKIKLWYYDKMCKYYLSRVSRCRDKNTGKLADKYFGYVYKYLELKKK